MSRARAYRAVVTGAGGGIGRALALELGRRQSVVVVSDLDLDGARETAKRVQEAGGEAHALRCDVSLLSEVEAMHKQAVERCGEIDLLINNAGVVVGGPIDEIAMTDWEWIVGINFWGAVHGCRVFVPGFKAQRFGKILNVASIAGVVAPPEMAPYNMTKAAVVALSETLSVELGPWNITTTVMCPTAVRTGLVDAMRTTNPLHRTLAIKRARGRGRSPEEVARAAIDTVDAGRLYAFPHADGRFAWRFKRYLPSGFAWAVRQVRNRRLIERAIGATER